MKRTWQGLLMTAAVATMMSCGGASSTGGESAVANTTSTKDACHEALLTATRDPFQDIGKAYRCNTITKLADKNNDPTNFGYKAVFNKPDSCVLLYKDHEGNDRGVYMDLANGISQWLVMRGGDYNDYWGRNSAWNVYPLNNNYNNYRFDPETLTLNADEQVIGIGRYNKYVMQASCVEEAE